MSRTIADDSVVSKLEMRKRLSNSFNKFVVVHSEKMEIYKGKTLETFQRADFTVSLIEHFIAYLEDSTNTFGTARVYLSSLYVLLKEKHLEFYNTDVSPHTIFVSNSLTRIAWKKVHCKRWIGQMVEELVRVPV